jgi:hypothetical protein
MELRAVTRADSRRHVMQFPTGIPPKLRYSPHPDYVHMPGLPLPFLLFQNLQPTDEPSLVSIVDQFACT